MHQERPAILPDLKRQLAFVGVPHLMSPCPPQGLVEGLVQRLARAVLYRQAHDALEQAGILGEVGVIHLVNFVAAVVVVVKHQQARAEQQQQHHAPQCALAQRTHALASTR